MAKGIRGKPVPLNSAKAAPVTPPKAGTSDFLRKPREDSDMRVIKQIVSEFWIQFLISIGWATYQIWPIGASIASVNKALPTFITNFSGAFFFLSWGMSQFFRIKRQNEVKDEFSKVKSELSSLLDLVREKTEYLIGHTTGSESIGWFEFMQVGNDTFQLMFTNSSKYPLFDVSGDWVELNEPFDIYAPRHPFDFGTVGT